MGSLLESYRSLGSYKCAICLTGKSVNVYRPLTSLVGAGVEIEK